MSRSDLSKDDLFQALKHFQGSEYDMFTGNCGIFAYALQQYLGAEKKTVM